MKKNTFNIGPSKVSLNTQNDVKWAADNGIMEISHRGAEFKDWSGRAISGLREYLRVPKGYHIFYTDSATQAMQLALLNCCEERSFHYTCGNFSGLFRKVAEANVIETGGQEVLWGEKNDYMKDEGNTADFVSITHTETTTGVMCTQDDIWAVRKRLPEAILAVDITSAGGAVELDISSADIWLFSVQKCFGLPSGLAIMIVSERAVAKSLMNPRGKGYFSFERLVAKINDDYQTLFTPNVLGIYLLARKMERWNASGGLSARHTETVRKRELFDEFVAGSRVFDYLAKKPEDRALTVICLEVLNGSPALVHERLGERGIVIGKGYGKLKDRTVRIANFPGCGVLDMGRLISFLGKF